MDKSKTFIRSILTITIALCVFVGMMPLVSDCEADAASSVKLSKSKVTMYVGTSTTLKMKGTKAKVKWSSSNSKVVKVSTKGKITAKKVGSATIKAKVGKKTYKCKVSVKKVPKLSKTSATIYAGKSTTLKISGTKIGKPTWSSSKKSVAKVSSSGKVTGLKKGTAYIYAKIGGETLKCKVTVKTVAVKSIELNPTVVNLYVGQTYTYKPKVSPSNATITGMKWSSDDPCVTVKDGKVTAIAPGSATIYAKVGGKSDYSYVMVKAESLTLNEERFRMFVGETQKFKATIDPGVVPGKKVQWRSSDPSIATVDQNGVVTGKSKGSVKIYGKLDGNERYKSITIEAPDVDINEYNKTLYVGDTYDVGYEVEQGTANNPVVWSSDNNSVATVDQNGRVTAIGAGSTKIRISCAGGTDYISITVKKLEATSLILSTSESVKMGETLKLDVTVKPDKYPLEWITWTSDDTSIASVDANGVVTAHYPGTTYVYATAGTITKSCKIKVTGVAVTSLTFDKSSATKYPGETVQINTTISPSNATIQDITWKSSNEAVATVSNGLVTCHGEGSATITGTCGGRSAYFNITVVQKPAVLNVGEVWTVDGNFRFVVNSVVEHKKCNTIQNDKGDQVVVVDYTYYNDGFMLSSGTGLAIGAPSQMKIYDKNGDAGSTYVCFDDKTPSAVDIGRHCNATQAFILPAESDTMELVLDVVLNAKHYKATVNLTLKEPIDVIKDYWIENGEVEEEGYCITAESYGNVGVTYNPETQQFIFTEVQTTGDVDAGMQIRYDLINKEVTSVDFVCLNYPMDYSYTAEAEMDAATYRYGDSLNFTTTSGSLPEFVSESQLKETANLTLNNLIDRKSVV